MADIGLGRTHHAAVAASPTGTDAAGPYFSPLEWSIVRLASADGLATLRTPGPVGRFINRLMGQTGSVELASPRLEALRRIAVLSWNFGLAVPADAIAEFLSAGFSRSQYELLVGRIGAASTARQGGPA